MEKYFNINKVIEKETKKEIIDELFNQTYMVKTAFLRDAEQDLLDAKEELARQGFDDSYIESFKVGTLRENITGFYICLPFNANLKNVNPLFRMFYTIEKEAKKIMIGDELACDVENTLQNARLFILECLIEIIDGKFNNKFENDLKISNLNDFRLILLDSNLSRKLANFIITYVKYKFTNLNRSSSNPDFRCVWDKHQNKWVFEKIMKVYLDKELPNSNDTGYKFIENIVQEEEEYFGKTFIKFVIEEYIHKNALLDKQQKFWEDALRLGINSKELKEIYSKQLINKYKNNILNRLEKKLANDDRVKFLEFNCLNRNFTYKWRLRLETVDGKQVSFLDKYGKKQKERYEVINKGRWVLTENYCTLNNKKLEEI